MCYVTIGVIAFLFFGKGVFMEAKIMDKETVTVLNAGLTGVVSGYCEVLNPIITALIGIATFSFICSKVYWYNKNKGKEKE